MASSIVFTFDAEPEQVAQLLEFDQIEESEFRPAGHLFVAGLGLLQSVLIRLAGICLWKSGEPQAGIRNLYLCTSLEAEED